jgi:hypothetical protein
LQIHLKALNACSRLYGERKRMWRDVEDHAESCKRFRESCINGEMLWRFDEIGKIRMSDRHQEFVFPLKYGKRLFPQDEPEDYYVQRGSHG